jgi:hypothetical protein
MPAMDLRTEIQASARMSPRARKYFEEEFMPRYRALQAEIRRTPLVILVWGPGESGGDLYKKRLQIRDALRMKGHAAVFSEEIAGGDIDVAMSLKGQEFLQAHAADLVVVIQSSYGSVAEVHDFAEFRVVAFKLLIFIDERAKDGYSYQGALEELRTLYGNVETYQYPRDIVECRLLDKVMQKVDVLQVTKWRAFQSARGWGLV